MGLMQGKKANNIFFQYPFFKNYCLPYIKQNERRVIIQCGEILPSYIPELANLTSFYFFSNVYNYFIYSFYSVFKLFLFPKILKENTLCYFYFLFKIFIGVQLIYSVVLVSAVLQSASVTSSVKVLSCACYFSTPWFYPIIFRFFFPCRPLHSIEQTALCYRVAPYQLSILYMLCCDQLLS